PPLDSVALLSLGTGRNLEYLRGRRHDWGFAQWARPLISLMLDGTVGIADYQCRQLLGERYHRLAPAFPPGLRIGMDEIRRLPELGRFAEALPIDDTLAWLRRWWVE
ncbi:MAG: hypothetical protein NZ773_16360, partial [Dehalococcoidia bacterium]|nr:hypothetical protein [Dehalococcoidia bacterium]